MADVSIYIMPQTPSEDGQYQALQKWPRLTPPEGFYWWPDDLERDTFEAYEGFIIPVIKRGTVASYTANEEAYEAWKEAHPEPGPDPEPTPGGDEYATYSELGAAWREGVNSVD